MKCPMCGKAELQSRRVPFGHYGRNLGEFEADVCPVCGEVFFTQAASEEINLKAMELGLWGQPERALSWMSDEFPIEADLFEVPSPSFLSVRTPTVGTRPPERGLFIVRAKPESTSGEDLRLKALGVHPRAQTA